MPVSPVAITSALLSPCALLCASCGASYISVSAPPRRRASNHSNTSFSSRSNVATWLAIQHHSAVELVDRAVSRGLVRREHDSADSGLSAPHRRHAGTHSPTPASAAHCRRSSLVSERSQPLAHPRSHSCVSSRAIRSAEVRPNAAHSCSRPSVVRTGVLRDSKHTRAAADIRGGARFRASPPDRAAKPRRVERRGAPDFC